MKTFLNSGINHNLIGFSIILIMIALIVGVAGCGDNSPHSQNLEIRDWYDLDAIRDNLRGNHFLMNNLDSTTTGYAELVSPTANEGKGWRPIGTWSLSAFTGSFDGQGHEICELFINRPDESAVGIFGVIEAGVVIENIGVVLGNVTGYEDVGSLVGYNRGTVKNSYACGNVTGDLNVGSLVGVNDGTVSNSYSSGSGAVGRDGVGGLLGKNQGTLSNSYTSGTVNGNDFVGGLVGRNEGTVSKCYSTGNVTGDEYIGGLVGQNLYGVVSNSFWDTQTSGQATSDGGTGKTTAEMMGMATFSGATWDIVAVVNSGTRNTEYVWNILDDETYPFLSWQPI